MTRFQYRLLRLLSMVFFVLGLTLLILGIYRTHLEKVLISRQTVLSQAQADLNRGMAAQRLGQNFVNELERLSMEQPVFKEMLGRYAVPRKDSLPAKSP